MKLFRSTALKAVLTSVLLSTPVVSGSPLAEISRRQLSSSAPTPTVTVMTEWAAIGAPLSEGSSETTTDEVTMPTSTPTRYPIYVPYTGSSFSPGSDNTTVLVYFPITYTDYEDGSEVLTTVTATNIAVAGPSTIVDKIIYEHLNVSITDQFVCRPGAGTIPSQGICVYDYAYGTSTDEPQTYTYEGRIITYTAILTPISLPSGVTADTAIAAAASPTTVSVLSGIQPANTSGTLAGESQQPEFVDLPVGSRASELPMPFHSGASGMRKHSAHGSYSWPLALIWSLAVMAL